MSDPTNERNMTIRNVATTRLMSRRHNSQDFNLRQHRCENLKPHKAEADEKLTFQRRVNSRLFYPVGAGGRVGKSDKSVVTVSLPSPEMRISATKYAKLAMFWHKTIHIYYNPNTK